MKSVRSGCGRGRAMPWVGPGTLSASVFCTLTAWAPPREPVAKARLRVNGGGCALVGQSLSSRCTSPHLREVAFHHEGSRTQATTAQLGLLVSIL